MESRYKNSPIYGCHTVECMKKLLNEHPEIKFEVNDL